MSAKDIVHEIVRQALEKDGWVITHDPLFLRVSENIGMFLNLAANKVIIANRETLKIAVEFKSFVGLSAVTDFHLAREHPKVANSPLLIIVDLINFPPSPHLPVKLQE